MKTYEELEIDRNFAEHQLAKAKEQCVELTQENDELRDKNDALTKQLAKSNQWCDQLILDRDDYRLELEELKARSCETCVHCNEVEIYHYDEDTDQVSFPIGYQCLKFASRDGKGINCTDAFAVDSSGYCATFNILNPKFYCSLWEAK